ncbi:hypothetical protein DSECCO2_424040 [anaerobic digester metagenome]
MNLRKGCIFHNGARRLAEHIGQVEIDGPVSRLTVFKNKLLITCSFSDHEHRRPFSAGHLLKQIHIRLMHDQAHTLLRFVSDDLPVRKCRISHR